MNTKAKIKKFATAEQEHEIESILECLAKRLYPSDWQMLNGVREMAQKMKASSEFTLEHTEMLLGFYKWWREKHANDLHGILSTYLHDIRGIVNQERMFMPRAYAYRQFYDNKPIKFGRAANV